MSVKLRLARAGAKKNPYYHVVAADSRKPRDGKFIEAIGKFDPSAEAGKQFVVDAERLSYWLKAGAQPTGTVAEHIKRFQKANPAPAAAKA